MLFSLVVVGFFWLQVLYLWLVCILLQSRWLLNPPSQLSLWTHADWSELRAVDNQLQRKKDARTVLARRSSARGDRALISPLTNCNSEVDHREERRCRFASASSRLRTCAKARWGAAVRRSRTWRTCAASAFAPSSDNSPIYAGSQSASWRNSKERSRPFAIAREHWRTKLSACKDTSRHLQPASHRYRVSKSCYFQFAEASEFCWVTCYTAKQSPSLFCLEMSSLCWHMRQKLCERVTFLAVWHDWMWLFTEWDCCLIA